jgi:hypothetical protein
VILANSIVIISSQSTSKQSQGDTMGNFNFFPQHFQQDKIKSQYFSAKKRRNFLKIALDLAQINSHRSNAQFTPRSHFLGIYGCQITKFDKNQQ